GINTVWRWGKIKSIENLNVNIKAKKMKNGGYQIVEKYREAKKMARSVWWDTDTNTEKGTITVKEMFDAKVFDYPKPVEMLERIIQMATDNEEDDIVMDFFSGSASFAHAILVKNAKENYINKFIMIQLTEKVKEGSIAESESFKTIDEIGQKRIELAAKKIKEENPEADIDYGFKHYTLVEPLAITIDKLESFEQNSMVTDNDILKEFGKETVLATWINDDGYGLTCTPQEIDLSGYKAYYMGKHLYLLDAEFNNEAQKALFERYSNEPSFNPENIVLFGYSFSKWTIMDSLQTNLRQLANKKINFDIRY
ncbi:MAG: site-specific DNA-methyltransferase, partial [Sphingobacteriia bacterium]|nr:site-specific DNA-methyltransferase [Sphingobacteriia bacterium]